MLDADAQLAAEAAANAGHDDSDLRGRHLEDLRKRVLHLEGKLGVGPDRDGARAVPLRHSGARLCVALVDHARAEPVLEDAVRLLPAPLHVAHHDARAVADVAIAMKDRDRHVARPVLMHEWSAWSEGGLEVED